jgi:TRAP transporter 4TM/12TM fusion protein
MGTITGSTTANVVGTGVFTIPLMKKVGYDKNFAGAVEAVSSNGGQIMPPVMGAVAFLISEVLQISYGVVCIAAVIPALLYFLATFIMVDLEAAKKGLKGLPKSSLRPLRDVIKEGWFHLVTLFVLIVLLVGLMYAPERSALYSLAVMIALSYMGKVRLTPSKFVAALEEGAKGMVMVGTTCAAAGIIVGCITLTGLGAKLSTFAVSIAGSNLFLVLAMAAVSSFVLGMGMSSIPCYLMVSIIVAPILIKCGILPIAAHLFVFWWALVSFITPPVAIAAYAAASISGGDPLKTGINAMRLGITTFIIPFIFVYEPAMILEGTPFQILHVVGTSIVGIVLLSAGLIGYLITDTDWWERTLLIVGGFGLILPGWITNMGACALMIIVLLWQVKKKHSYKSSLDFRD